MNRRNRSEIWAVPLLVLTLCAGCARRTGNDGPGLVVVVVVDMLRGDSFDRFGHVFTGGFKWVMENGVMFEEARHGHATTATAPGHFAIGSGRHPGPAGIVGNYWYDRVSKQDVYAVEDPTAKAVGGKTRSVSYAGVDAAGLGDHVQAASRRAKVISIGGKDRGAILLGGQHPDAAYWFDFESGRFVTTSHYVRRLPSWVAQFNARRSVDRFREATWNRLLPSDSLYLALSREDDFPAERLAEEDGGAVFPHRPKVHSSEPTNPFEHFWETPWLDQVVLDLAKDAMVKERLGKDSPCDLLFLALSATDGVGHRYGPFSQEYMDNLLRLDRALGEWLEFVDEKVGLDKVAVVLTSDHGCAVMPEFAERVKGKRGGRYGALIPTAVERLEAKLSARFGGGDYIGTYLGEWVYYNLEVMSSAGLTRADLDEVAVPALEKEDWIARVFTRDQLVGMASGDTLFESWQKSFHPERSGDLAVLVEPGWIEEEPTGSGHGTPYFYDSHVPFIVAGKAIAPGRVAERVWTTDVAPTVASLMGIAPLPGADGIAHPIGWNREQRLPSIPSSPQTRE